MRIRSIGHCSEVCLLDHKLANTHPSVLGPVISTYWQVASCRPEPQPSTGQLCSRHGYALKVDLSVLEWIQDWLVQVGGNGTEATVSPGR